MSTHDDLISAITNAQTNQATIETIWLEQKEQFAEAEKAYNALMGKTKVTPEKLTALLKDNWGKIASIAAAFGIPLGAADPGAFSGIISKFSGLLSFLPFF